MSILCTCQKIPATLSMMFHRPVYLTKNARHKYAEFIMQVGKNTKHSFSDIQKAAEKMKNLHRQVLHAEDKTII